MEELSVGTRLAGNVQATVADTLVDIMDERGRGFASDQEAWACLKEQLEKAKSATSNMEKLHKEMWDAVRERNPDAFGALAMEFERSSRFLAMEWVTAAAMGKIAVELTGE